MKRATFLIFFLGFITVSHGQTTSQPFTSEDHDFFRFLLVTAAGLDCDPETLQMIKLNISQQYGFSDADAAVVWNASQQLKQVLGDIRNEAENREISSVRAVSYADLINRRDSKIDKLAVELLNSISPSVAHRFREAAHVAAQAGMIRIKQGDNQ